ncbi:MAG: HNH endonuclease signature motif containing protein [Planctomycetota bacterium]
MTRRKPPNIRPRRGRRVDLQDRARGSAASRGYDADHRRWRLAVLRRDPLCVLCKREGRITPATVADHIVPIAVDPSRRLDLDNGRGLCVTCHANVTDRFKREGINEPRSKTA